MRTDGLVEVSQDCDAWRELVVMCGALILNHPTRGKERERVNIRLQLYNVSIIYNIKCKKLTSLQHFVRATNSHIQNSKNHFTRPS